MLHTEVDSAFDGGGDVDVVVVSVFVLNMSGDYALPHDGVGGGDEAVGGKTATISSPVTMAVAMVL